MPDQHRTWWKEAVIYQIYPMSFMDSNNDGIGDLPGLMSKLDYLQYLGIDALWITPVYDSPNDDNGYDVRDYLSIAPQFGTMKDMETLIEELHSRGIRLIMDWVLNHSSDEHEWFEKACLSKDNPYHDYYIFQRHENGPPCNWRSMFGGSVWQYVEKLQEYYLHLYSRKMPDLNWENPEMRQAVYDMMLWWINKGVDGYRLDSLATLAKDTSFPNVPSSKEDGLGWGGRYFLNRSPVHEYLKEMNERVFSSRDVMTVGETGFISPEDALKYAGYERKELDTVFQFEIFDRILGTGDITEPASIPPAVLKQVFTLWQEKLQDKAWNTLFLENHDLPRSVSLMGDDGLYRELSAKALATLLLTLQGTPYIFQGQEIGMTNVNYSRIDSYRDIRTFSIYDQLKKRKNLSEEEIMKVIHQRSRDNARSPMQWNDSVYAGFSKQKPWISLNANYSSINVENEMGNPNSILHYYRDLIRLRKNYPDLVYGSFVPSVSSNEDVFTYCRHGKEYDFFIALNLGKKEQDLENHEQGKNYKPLIGNYSDFIGKDNSEKIRPYEARVFIKKR